MIKNGTLKNKNRYNIIAGNEKFTKKYMIKEKIELPISINKLVFRVFLFLINVLFLWSK